MVIPVVFINDYLVTKSQSLVIKKIILVLKYTLDQSLWFAGKMSVNCSMKMLSEDKISNK